MINKPLKDVEFADIQALQVQQIAEGKTLEYKEEMYSIGPEGSKKLLREICALANTAGGDLIFGIKEEGGIAVGTDGIECEDHDALRLRIENAARDMIQPRLSNIDFCFVPTAAGRFVLVIRVPRSWSAPHRLSADGHFYARNSAGGYQLDVGELRQAFTLSESVVERIKEFRIRRLQIVGGNLGPVDLADGVVMVFHMIPLSAFASATLPAIEFGQIQPGMLPVVGSSATRGSRNLDGYVSSRASTQDKSQTYTQLFRDGAAETVASYPDYSDGLKKPISSGFLERGLVNCVDRFRSLLEQYGVEAPFFFFLSFLNVTGSSLVTGASLFTQVHPLSERNADTLVLPASTVESNDFDVAQALKPLFDSYWNAFGKDGSENYDADGQWSPVS